jgi:ribosomal protein L24E
MMADEVRTCGICSKAILAGEPAVFVKPKGAPVRWYHEKCVKEEGKKKNDTFRKRH